MMKNKENYNMKSLAIKIWGLLLLMCLFMNVSAQKKISSDDLLKQAIYQTNIKKNYPAAIALAKKGLAISPNYFDIRVLLGRLYMLTNNTQQAEIELKKVLAKKPNQPDALNYLVNLNYQNNNYTTAVDYASNYLKYYPEDKNMMLKKAAMLYDAKSFDAGNAYLQNLVTQYPNDKQIIDLYTDLHLTTANNWRKQQNYTTAIIEYNKVLVLKPADTTSIKALYNLTIQLNNKEKALQYAALIDDSNDMALAMSKTDLLRSMNRFDEALANAEKLRVKYPGNDKVDQLYKDILYVKAKHNLQQADTSTAFKSYEQVLQTFPADTFARNQLINLSVAKNNRTEAVRYIDEGINYYPDKQSILLKKMNITQAMGENRQAYEIAKTLKEEFPENEKIRSINDDLFVLSLQNRIGATYGHTAFDQQAKKPWNLYSLYYMRTEKFGSIIGRVNYADRRDATGYQFELEAYLKHKYGYSYANAALSNSLIFPKFRFAYSYFLPFAKSYEAEVGVRYLTSFFNYTSYTASLGKYFGSYWLNAKTYITPNGGKVAAAYILTGRYYFGDSNEKYLTAIAGYGFSPDDRGRNFEITERLNLKALRFTLGYQTIIWKQNLIGLFGTYNHQEYVPGRYRNEFDMQISFQHKF